MSRTGPAVACRLILVVGVVACLATTAAAQRVVRGLVRDQNGQGISGATVTGGELSSTTSETTTTNDSGRFALIGLRGGEWRFVIRADGFQPAQLVTNVRRSGTTAVQLTMERDWFNPPAPTGGVLAGLKTAELVESLEMAEGLFDRGEYDAAIDAYRSILERTPALTSVSLQIGHAFREKQEPDRALDAYRTVLDADPSNVEAQAAIDAVSQTVR